MLPPCATVPVPLFHRSGVPPKDVVISRITEIATMCTRSGFTARSTDPRGVSCSSVPIEYKRRAYASRRCRDLRRRGQQQHGRCTVPNQGSMETRYCIFAFRSLQRGRRGLEVPPYEVFCASGRAAFSIRAGNFIWK
jgi:hypothetical protein